MLELFGLFLNNVNILRKICKEIRLGGWARWDSFFIFLGRMLSECGLESFILLFDLKCRYAILDMNDVSFRMYYLSSLIQLSAYVHEFDGSFLAKGIHLEGKKVRKTTRMHTLISLSDQSNVIIFFQFEYMSNRNIWIPQLKVYLEFFCIC